MPRRDKRSKVHKEIVEKITNYILNNLHEALDLKRLADNANMSSFHFHRIFTQLKGETPHNYKALNKANYDNAILYTKNLLSGKYGFMCQYLGLLSQ